ncbi:Dual-specificity kinase, spindle pole body (SPB) duplication and spindle checkpoint function [Entomortierella lignicola]|nr:Dual-specificity kinase, spindle pole body (SPB) duplication and spindle checkpoint function [Entomortierella lignicola]
MTDLEAREKKRAPPPKLQPIKVDQLKDKEAYLADYFGEASLPFNVTSTVIRPPKRPIYPKAKTVSSSSLVNAVKPTNSNYNSNNNAVVDDNDPVPPTTSATVTTSNSVPVLDQAPAMENYKSTYSASVNKSTPAEAPLLPKLRSSSRLAIQDSFQRIPTSSIVDPGKPSIEEPIEASSELKPPFVTPQPKPFKNPPGKENHLPQTQISSRLKNLKPVTKAGPRKSFNWGRPHRGDVPDTDDQEDSKASVISGADVRSDQERRESPTTPAARSSESHSPDLSIQELPMDDLSVSQTRGRQGNNRDYDESASVTKKMKQDNDGSSMDNAEFSPQPPPRRTEALTINSSFAPVSKATSVPSSSKTTAQSIESPKESIETKVTSKPQSPVVIIDEDNKSKEKENTMAPPRSPQITRSSQSSSKSQPVGAPHQKSIPQSSHAEGIASIAQHLAVGSAKAPPMPRHGTVGAQKQVGSVTTPAGTTIQSTGESSSTIPAVTVPASTSASQSSIPMSIAPGRAELGARQVMMVNNRPYTKLAQVGKGGSSKVYKVLASNSRIFALKKVSFEKAEQATITGYVNEVNLLTRLANNLRIIRLWDAEINYSKGSLSLLMEYGEIDLAHMLFNQREQPFDIHFIGFYWRQMLEAVQVIHDEKIVHSDLKPANFLLVEGSLKLIDFGIANAIANDTTNIHREGQFGTANYMSPEAIATNPAGEGFRKLGRASDVWSLGCILYQMVYGKTPFSDVLNVYQKLNLITNPNHRIEFPERVFSPLQPKRVPSLAAAAATEIGDAAAGPKAGSSGEAISSTVGAAKSEVNNGSTTSSPPATIANTAKVDPDLIRIMKGCLEYKAKDRMSIPDLLLDPFLHRN